MLFRLKSPLYNHCCGQRTMHKFLKISGKEETFTRPDNQAYVTCKRILSHWLQNNPSSVPPISGAMLKDSQKQNA